MKKGTEFAAAGISAGVVSAAVPIAYSAYLTKKRRPIWKSDMLRAENGKLVTEGGEEVKLIGLDLSPENVKCRENGEEKKLTQKQLFDSLEERFGNYGAREVFGRYYENLISKPDIKAFKKSGINCVRIPIYSYIAFKDGSLKKIEPDLDRIDKIVAGCKKAGIYVILSLSYAPGFSDSEEDLFLAQNRKGLSCRNDTIKMWAKISTHFKDEPAIAAYELLDKASLGFECGETTSSFFIRAAKALRTLEDPHVLCVPYDDKNTDYEKLKELNIAVCVGGGYCSAYEAKALSGKAETVCQNGVPALVTGLVPSSFSGAYGELSPACSGCVMARYKGSENALYRSESPVIDIAQDSFDGINDKLSGSANLKAFDKNGALEKELKEALSGVKFKKVINKPVKIKYARGKAYFAGI